LKAIAVPDMLQADFSGEEIAFYNTKPEQTTTNLAWF
jgi:hypothetical protein